MKANILWFRHTIVIASCLFCSALANAEGIWSKAGIVPSFDVDANKNTFSPDKKHYVRATIDGLFLGEINNKSLQPLSVAAMPPLWEVLWAPDSNVVAVNFSDGGAVGTWDVDIFEVDSSNHLAAFQVSALIRNAARSLPRCEPIEDVNVALIGWSNRGDIAFLVAEVPPHSSCKNMGELQGFEVSMSSKKILKTIPESVLRNKWLSLLGDRISTHHTP